MRGARKHHRLPERGRLTTVICQVLLRHGTPFLAATVLASCATNARSAIAPEAGEAGRDDAANETDATPNDASATDEQSLTDAFSSGDVLALPDARRDHCPSAKPAGMCAPSDWSGCQYASECCVCRGPLPGGVVWECTALNANPGACPASVPSNGQPCTAVVSCNYCVLSPSPGYGMLAASCTGAMWTVLAQ